jgi:DNA-directed RNA polymerase specialized sigma24 family protein
MQYSSWPKNFDMSEAQVKSPYPAPDPERWLDDHGDYLFKYAVFRLRDDNVAEDAVQETFLAALRAYENFEGRGRSERGWSES